jgi:glycosyltransferase involved in cell wall biosynthesis
MPELMKTIFALKDDSFAVRMMCRLEKWSLGFADLVITVNVACKRIFSDRSCRSEKVGVVMNSPDEEIFPYREARSYSSAERDQHRPFVVMYHGSLVERNGLDLAVEALASVCKSFPNVELKICGRSSPYLEQVMERARAMGVAGSIRYLGPKRLEELVGEIETCDIGVIPNQRNAFTDINTPTRIFEYLALGKPVIAPSTPGIMDYFGENSLLLIDSGNVADIARQIEYSARNYQRTVEIAEVGQQVYLKHRWGQERQTLVTLVSTLLSGSQA